MNNNEEKWREEFDDWALESLLLVVQNPSGTCTGESALNSARRGYLEARRVAQVEIDFLKSDLEDLDKTFIDQDKELGKCLGYISELEGEIALLKQELKDRAKLYEERSKVDHEYFHENQQLRELVREAIDMSAEYHEWKERANEVLKGERE